MDPSFEISVQIFIRIQLRSIRRQIENLYFLLMVFEPFFNFFTVMGTQIIQNQKNLMVRVFNQPTHKFNQELAGHVVPVHHKSDQALVGDGRDHIDTALFGRKSYHRRFPLGGKAPRPISIRLESGLVAPMNHRFFFLRLGHQTGIFCFQPMLDHLRVLLIRPFNRFLWCKSPALQISTYGPDGHLHTVELLDQKPDSLPGPQGKGQIQLIRCLIDQQAFNFRFLGGGQRSFLPLPTSSPSQLDGSATLLLVALPEGAGMALAKADPSGPHLGWKSLFAQPDDLFPYLVLGLWTMLACICLFPAQCITYFMAFLNI